MYQEREMILNNLDLNGIADEEVIKLYTGVLDEIGQIELAAKEKKLFKDKHRRAFMESLAANVFVVSGYVATANFVGAVRQGARSWWDYRHATLNRDFDLWRVEKSRETAVMQKSSMFLENFWKLAQKKNIPDRWLIRSTDLEKLDEAMQEDDPEVRLRVLKRMERFMECYPPYWYYVARTQQTLGQLFAAAQTYEKLGDLAAGHFRKDDMLTASLANRAAIQEYLGQPSASMTAIAALRHSTSVWEANLMCAQVLSRHELYEEAEDAVLRNIDVDLETELSTGLLATIYIDAGQREKLVKLLSSKESLAVLPGPVLVRSIVHLGRERTPAVAMQQLRSSFYARPRLHFRSDDLILVTGATWKADGSRALLQLGGRVYRRPRVHEERDTIELRFERVREMGLPFQPNAGPLNPVITLNYPEMPLIHVSLRRLDTRANSFRPAALQYGNDFVSLLAGDTRPLAPRKSTATSTPKQQATPVAPRREESRPMSPPVKPQAQLPREDTRETAPPAPPPDFSPVPSTADAGGQ
jgi:hypothetical protein